MDRSWLTGFPAMATEKQVVWLSRFIFLMTMFARETYDTESSGLRDGAKMRRYNELTHRLSSQLQKIMTESTSGMPDDVFVEYLTEALSELKIDEEYLRKQLV